MSLIVGLGSPHGDDQIGWSAIDLLLPRLPAEISAVKLRGPIELLECLNGHDAAIVIDAATPSGRPGLIRSFIWPDPELAECPFLSSHGLGLVEALQLAQVLGRLPRSMIVHTIEAADISPGAAMSDDVAQQLGVLVESIFADLSR